jgi:hypothetical protein
MAVSEVSSSMNQVNSFMSNQAVQGFQNATSPGQNSDGIKSGVIRGGVVHGGQNDAAKVSFSSAALSMNSILSGA